MAYTVTLYVNMSDPHYFNKNIGFVADVACEIKNPEDIEEPEISIMATDAYDPVNYVYIPHFRRYYYATPTLGRGSMITFKCKSDPLMSFKNEILACPAVIARNPWAWDLYLPDPNLPVESRTIKGVIPFPVTTPFSGNNNCYIVTTLGPGGDIISTGGDE